MRRGILTFKIAEDKAPYSAYYTPKEFLVKLMIPPPPLGFSTYVLVGM
jgi:hypothetical protein